MGISKKKSIHIICAVDKHCKYVTNSVEKIKNLFPLDDIHVCNFNSGNSQLQLKSLCEKENFKFREFLFEPITKSRLVCNEIIAMLKISDFFYKEEYERVFLLHGDIEILQNYKEDFNKIPINKKWSVAAPLIDFTQPREEEYLNKLWENSKNIFSKNIETHSIARLTQSCLVFNPLFIKEINKNFLSIDDYFLNMFRDSSPYGDCGLFDCNHLGFEVYPILNPISFEKKWLSMVTEEDFEKKFKNIKYIHHGL